MALSNTVLRYNTKFFKTSSFCHTAQSSLCVVIIDGPSLLTQSSHLGSQIYKAHRSLVKVSSILQFSKTHLLLVGDQHIKFSPKRIFLKFFILSINLNGSISYFHFNALFYFISPCFLQNNYVSFIVRLGSIFLLP